MPNKPTLKNIFLIEVSWEVCNKVGGISTVLRTKMEYAHNQFRNRYLLIGPLLESNPEFVEKPIAALKPIQDMLEKLKIPCRLGYWDMDGKPWVILVGFQNRYKSDELLYNLWKDFGIDSSVGNYDYLEPILFATACGEVIKALADNQFFKKYYPVAHFHEWMSGAGILFLKKQAPSIATVFTTHATVLGRALAGNHRSIENLPSTFDPHGEAKIYGVFAKHSIEQASAREADCFTTVSTVTANEARRILQKYPDQIVYNGLNIEEEKSRYANECGTCRAKLIEIASRTLGQTIPSNALLWVTSGRFEFHNKGYDVILSALAQLKQRLPPTSPPIVFFFLIAAQQPHTGSVEGAAAASKNLTGIAIHPIANSENDIIVRRATELGLRDPNSPLHVVYSNVYLNGADGVFNVSYEQILAACDHSVFPSLYEPWGYTPLESLVFATPTITTNSSGFGQWILSLKEDHREVVTVLDAKEFALDAMAAQLTDHMQSIAAQPEEKRAGLRVKANGLAKLADWKYFYSGYLDAYQMAARVRSQWQEIRSAGSSVTNFLPMESTVPQFRFLHYESALPEKLGEMRNLAFNLWWSWNERARNLFQKIDPVLWEKCQNPVVFLDQVPNETLMQCVKNKGFMNAYHAVMTEFNAYLKNPPHIPDYLDYRLVNANHPIAYFCMEYGIDNCLPFYSGGLGILAGDYLKTISDLNIPMVAVGLFYKGGFFRQTVSAKGEQTEWIDEVNPKHLPMKEAHDESGQPLMIALELPDRLLHCRVWRIDVGKVPLYLLDTDVAENTEADRKITYNLYGGSRENRLLQEMVLGVGGARLLIEKLHISPSLYHLNEGHSAFLTIERMRQLYNSGFTRWEATRFIQFSSVFTTHTPVPAGNDVFSPELIKKYFAHYAAWLGVTIDELLLFGNDVNVGGDPVFSMSALALRMSYAANAVSRIHQKVSRAMWQKLWPGYLEQEVPISAVTNGIHIPTWLGYSLKALYHAHFGERWTNKIVDSRWTKELLNFSDAEVWKAHQSQKEKLLSVIQLRIIKEYTARRENRRLMNTSLDHLKDDVLLMGFGRRFTPYKRNTLLLQDREKLASLLCHPERPAVLVMVGKAHPSDTAGKEMIQSVFAAIRDPIFDGRIIFLENYDMPLAKALVQGVDIWLNTPLLGKEACGTSGMKAGINGGLNVSIRDGWWNEAFERNENAGWAIPSFEEVADAERRDEMESIELVDLLKNVVVPLYYANRHHGFNSAWVHKMKCAMIEITLSFDAQEMVKNYFMQLYSPLIRACEHLLKDNSKELKEVSEWKSTLYGRFGTVKIRHIVMEGLTDGRISSSGRIELKVYVFAGKMKPEELVVELIIGKSDGARIIGEMSLISLKLVEKNEEGTLLYAVNHHFENTGFYSYGVRVRPMHPLLPHAVNAGMVLWE